jgi:hypothetical protein
MTDRTLSPVPAPPFARKAALGNCMRFQSGVVRWTSGRGPAPRFMQGPPQETKASQRSRTTIKLRTFLDLLHHNSNPEKNWQEKLATSAAPFRAGVPQRGWMIDPSAAAHSGGNHGISRGHLPNIVDARKLRLQHSWCLVSGSACEYGVTIHVRARAVWVVQRRSVDCRPHKKSRGPGGTAAPPGMSRDVPRNTEARRLRAQPLWCLSVQWCRMRVQCDNTQARAGRECQMAAPDCTQHHNASDILTF